MMRLTVLAVSLFLSLPSIVHAQDSQRALFVSLIQKPPVLNSRSAIMKLMDFSQAAGVNTLFVQIYYRGVAWFPSKIVDDSPYEEYRKTLKEDPLHLLILQAHQHHIQVHAWFNTLSLGNNPDAYFIKKYGSDILTRNLEAKTKLEDFKIGRQYYLEPGDLRVRDDLAKIVTEVLVAYPDLDGIQFDYIRYPDIKPHYGYTKMNMDRFKEKTGLSTIDEGSLIWQNWRREQVTEVLSKLVGTVHALRPHMQVSTTGCMPYVRALYEAYQDWPSWLSSGLIDFVTIMDYADDEKDFVQRLHVIKEKVTDFSKVRVAVGAYKLLNAPETFKQEFISCQNIGTACTIFHYGSLLENPALGSFLTHPEK